MKVAVSIPDPIFAEAERLSRRLKTTRSDLFARALSAFIDSHDPDDVTEALNAAVEAAGGDAPDPFVTEAGRRIFAKIEW